MELNLTSEQVLLRDSALKFVSTAGPKVARKFRDGDLSFAPQRLREAGALGWLGILVPEAADGFGLGLTELALVLEQGGRGLVCEPIGLAAISAAALGHDAKPHAMLSRAMTGEALVVPALQERAHGDDPLSPSMQAVAKGATLRLTGQKLFVCADGADGFLVSAGGRSGPVLCFVERSAPGVSLQAADTVDGRRLATLNLANTPADLIAAHASSRNAVDTLYNLALLVMSAELLGVMEEAQRITLDYLRIRKQFGKLIGSFQALQHQAANIYLRTEAVRSLIYQVAANNEPCRIDPAMTAAAKAKASEDALLVTEACIQLHGAIGFTDEHDIGLYLKRAMLLSSLFGNAAAQRRRYVAIAGLTA
jgi:alkylation response protein AidB-like acyl-CoA dehydrogenase